MVKSRSGPSTRQPLATACGAGGSSGSSSITQARGSGYVLGRSLAGLLVDWPPSLLEDHLPTDVSGKWDEVIASESRSNSLYHRHFGNS